MKYILILFLFALDSKTYSQELRFVENELFGLKDSLGNILLYPQFQFISEFRFDVAIVAQNDLLGAIDKNGHIIMPIKYEYLMPLDNAEFTFGYRAIYFGEYTMGVINIHEEIIIPANYSIIGKYKQMYEVIIRKDSILRKDPDGDLRTFQLIHGVFNEAGQEVLPCEFDFIDWKNDTLLSAKKNNTYTLYSTTGKQLTNQPFMVIGDFKDDLAKVRIDNQYGFINTKGENVIPVNLDYCEEFDNGFAMIKKNSKWGAINKTGDIIIETEFEYEEVKKLIAKINGS